MGVALELKHFGEINPVGVSQHNINCYITVTVIKQLYLSNKAEHFSYKGGYGMCENTCIKVLKRKAGLGYR